MPSPDRAHPYRHVGIQRWYPVIVAFDAKRNEVPRPMRTRTKVIGASYLLICLTLDFSPRFGPPAFRYTGSDPTVPVWNLGWPLALVIYDPRNGLQVGPSVYLVPPAQLLILLGAMALVAVLRWAMGTASHRGIAGFITGRNS